MTTAVHFAYTCKHTLKIEEELVSSWIIKEFFSPVDFDPNTWADVNHDYGTIPVNDVCDVCKEEASKQRRKAKKASATPRCCPTNNTKPTPTSSTTASEKSLASD